MSDRQTTLLDMVGKTIEILGKTFTVDWIDAPKSEDNGKIMVQSDETEIYHIGDRFEAVADVMSEISSELMKGKGGQRMTAERMTIQLSETAEKLLKRIVESRLGSGSGSGLHLMCDCMIEHLIHEEARRLGVTDQDLEGKE